ncbi:MAG: C69 family dipeptidase, partial [Bacteroidales bacterium]
LALQRAKTAREAIEVITTLANEYGYASSGESISIADPSEVWFLEMIGKAPKIANGKNINKGWYG